MKYFEKKINNFVNSIGIFSSSLIILMISITFLVATFRYAFNMGNIAIQESIIYLHSFIFLMGSAYTLQNDMHVRIDILYNYLGENKKRLINLFGTLLLLFPTFIVIIITSFNYVTSSFLLLESSKEAGGLPLVYILKSFILLMAVLMILQGASQFIKYKK
ncbi:MAG: C4-dicarboxylate ABC transporter permease [Gammaproteobacteria bacterium]|nr:C4-dicarboxylate ABC transporter permease [Gammaproteobacteria bacterium]|tara:strand:+ start:60 stop:542 length:483 start_codon:yes stop_codon:yes gene_type:complete